MVYFSKTFFNNSTETEFENQPYKKKRNEKAMGLDEQEIEQLLRYGAYKMFTSETGGTSDKVI